jgi:hypothetical protein
VTDGWRTSLPGDPAWLDVNQQLPRNQPVACLGGFDESKRLRFTLQQTEKL